MSFFLMIGLSQGFSNLYACLFSFPFIMWHIVITRITTNLACGTSHISIQDHFDPLPLMAISQRDFLLLFLEGI